jgi:hypothetical protein
MSHSKLETVAKSYEALYSKQQPALELFSMETSTAQHFEVSDEQFTNEEIQIAARKIQAGRAPGPNPFCQDTVKQWADAEAGTDDARAFL